MKVLILTTVVVITLSACGDKPVAENPLNSSAPVNRPMMQPRSAESPLPTPSIPKDGTYKSHGLVTRVSNDLGSIEIEHDDIPNMMPAMKMEFYVKDKSMLNGIYANDEVNFVIEYKHPEEKIISLTKVKKAKKDED